MYFEQQLMFSAEYMHFIVYGRSGVPAREGVSEGMTDLGWRYTGIKCGGMISHTSEIKCRLDRVLYYDVHKRKLYSVKI